jgi:hypothetical protein
MLDVTCGVPSPLRAIVGCRCTISRANRDVYGDRMACVGEAGVHCNGDVGIRMTLLAVRSASRSAASDGDETFIALEH